MPPTAVIESLQGVRRRVRLLGLLSGIGLVVALAFATLLATVLLDYLLNLPPVPRLIVMLLAAAAVGHTLVRWVLRPLVARLSLGDIAGRLEEAFPQFDDRLRSTVAFLDHEVPGSDLMKQRVMGEAAELTGRLDLHRALVLKPVWSGLGAAASAALVMVLLALGAGAQLRGVAISRLLSPFSAQGWPKRVQIELVGQVPHRVPFGQRIPIGMRLVRGDRASTKAVILYRYGTGAWQQELMTRGDDGVYAASLDANIPKGAEQGMLQVRLQAGDDLRELDPITILPRLAVRTVEATVVPPPYIAATPEPVRFNLAAGSALVPAGSQVSLRIAFNKPLDPAQPVALEPIRAEQAMPSIQWQASGNAEVLGVWTAEQSLRFHIRANDTDGFSSSGIEEYDLIVRPDQDPLIQIELPRRNEERTLEAMVPLQAVAEDDYGVRWVKLIVDRLGDKKHWELDLVADGQPGGGATWTRLAGAGDRVRHRANYTWELAQLAEANLKPGDVLEFFLLAADNFALNGKTHDPVASGKLRIHIVSQQQLADAITNELRAISGRISEIKNSQDRTREETAGLAEDTAPKPQLDAADRAVAERLAGQQGTAASQTRQIATKLEDVQTRLAENRSEAAELDQLAGDVKNTLNRTAEGPMKAAAGDLTAVQQDDRQTPQDRQQTLDQATERQQQASDDLASALDRLSNIGDLQQTIDRIRAILEEQRKVSRQTREIGKNNIGKKPEQMSAEDREKLNEAAQEQDKLAERTNKALADMEQLAGQMAKTDPASAEAMKQAARTGQQQQVPQNQRKASESARQNQQSSAQTAQKQAEIGLELIISQLREAERRKLEELSRQLAALQQQLANLIRRQAGHNLDNLNLQGPDRVKQVAAEQLDELLAKAERARGVEPPTLTLPQLSTAQEQTERNTRDIARGMEELPDSAEPAARLLRAASRMERAIVHLRASALAEAYEPPQVEALAALEEARRIVDEQKRKADEKQQQQQKEAIRQAYMRIRGEQEKLNTETSRIDASPRLEDGSLRREEEMRLNGLPGEQGRLAEQITRLGQDLAALRSVVYVWANRDIAASMELVKEGLGKRATGPDTQAEQARIVEQLDAMIRNLALKPSQPRFEQRAGGGGGGGGGGGARLPTEAELRMLRDLQQAVNKTTQVLDRPERDKPRLLDLGNRQGELRTLLDQLLRSASQGQVKLGPEPDPDDQLPEEAGLEQVENQEIEQDLLDADPQAEEVETQTNRVGDRMARSRQRLAMNHDPGKTTQLIQKRILIDLDQLIEQASQQQESQSQPSSGQAGQRPSQPQPSGAQAPNQGGQTAAQQSGLSQAGEPQADLSRQDLTETAREWGQISPRLREAVMEGAGENPVEKYRRLYEDYTRAVSTRAGGQQ
jgi:hypothetical protein